MLSTSLWHVRQLKTFCIEGKIDRHAPNSFFPFVYEQTSHFVRDAATQTAQRQPVIIKSNVTGGRLKHQTEITLFLPAIYLQQDEGSLKLRPKGHSVGPCLMLSCDKGFCFLSYHCFWHVFQFGNILSGQKCREPRRGKNVYRYVLWKYMQKRE